jgi:hypothetical protein
MGKFANGKVLMTLGWACCIFITAMDVWSLPGVIRDLLGS